MNYYIILLIIILSTISLIISFPKTEHFESDTDIYLKYKTTNTKNTALFKAETAYLKDTYGDSLTSLDNDLLTISRCLKYAVPKNIDSFEAELTNKFDKLSFPYQKVLFNISSYTDIEKKVLSKLKEFYKKYNLEALNGPVYILLFQAPYIRVIDESCKFLPMSVQFNYHTNFNSAGYFIGKSNNCPSLPNTISQNETSVLMYILYPTYTKIGKFEYKNWENIKCNMYGVLEQFNYDPSCFIHCKDSNKSCGCLNSNKPYKARCLGDTNNKLDNTLYNYGILYMVNSVVASRRVHGNFFRTTNVHIKPYDYDIDKSYCKKINDNPLPLINQIGLKY